MKKLSLLFAVIMAATVMLTACNKGETSSTGEDSKVETSSTDTGRKVDDTSGSGDETSTPGTSSAAAASSSAEKKPEATEPADPKRQVVIEYTTDGAKWIEVEWNYTKIVDLNDRSIETILGEIPTGAKEARIGISMATRAWSSAKGRIDIDGRTQWASQCGIYNLKVTGTGVNIVAPFDKMPNPEAPDTKDVPESVIIGVDDAGSPQFAFNVNENGTPRPIPDDGWQWGSVPKPTDLFGYIRTAESFASSQRKYSYVTVKIPDKASAIKFEATISMIYSSYSYVGSWMDGDGQTTATYTTADQLANIVPKYIASDGTGWVKRTTDADGNELSAPKWACFDKDTYGYFIP